jgi:HAD superfamily hydrolase (TIGR01509 family)
MKRYQYILLDWDGNLAQTLDVWLKACREPLRKRGLNLTDAEIATCFGEPVERFHEWGITDIETAIQEMDAIAASLMPEVSLYPDTIEVLERLRMGNVETALITTSLRRNVIGVLDRYNIHHFFDVVITNEDTERHKPDPEPLEKALELLGGTKGQAVMIGDSSKDIAAANNAGIDSILFYPEEHQKFYNQSELAALNPTYTVNDFRQVYNIVFPPQIPSHRLR